MISDLVAFSGSGSLLINNQANIGIFFTFCSYWGIMCE